MNDGNISARSEYVRVPDSLKILFTRNFGLPRRRRSEDEKNDIDILSILHICM